MAVAAEPGMSGRKLYDRTSEQKSIDAERAGAPTPFHSPHIPRHRANGPTASGNPALR